jgi:hypothetical protein
MGKSMGKKSLTSLRRRVARKKLFSRKRAIDEKVIHIA